MVEMDYNAIQSWGTFVAAIFAGVALLISAWQTKQLRNEKKLTFRPWIVEGQFNYEMSRILNEKKEQKTISEWKKLNPQEQNAFGPTQILLMIPLKNFGQLAATVYGRHSSTPLTKPDRKSISKIEYSSPFVLMPQQEKMYLIADTYDKLGQAFQNDITYLILDFKYVPYDSKDEMKYGFMTKAELATFTILETWDEKTF